MNHVDCRQAYRPHRSGPRRLWRQGLVRLRNYVPRRKDYVDVLQGPVHNDPNLTFLPWWEIEDLSVKRPAEHRPRCQARPPRCQPGFGGQPSYHLPADPARKPTRKM